MSFMLSHHFFHENVGTDRRWRTYSFLRGLRGTTISPGRHYCGILVCAARQTRNAVPAGGLSFGGQTQDPIPFANCSPPQLLGLMSAASYQSTGSLLEKPERLVISDKALR